MHFLASLSRLPLLLQHLAEGVGEWIGGGVDMGVIGRGEEDDDGGALKLGIANELLDHQPAFGAQIGRKV